MPWCDEADGGLWPALVVQNGTKCIRAGSTGEDFPKVNVLNILGTSKQQGCGSDPNTYIGEEAQMKRGMLILSSPMHHGVVTDWDQMEQVWRHTFDCECRMVVGDETPADEVLSPSTTWHM